MARELVTVARFDIPVKAHIAQNALSAAGIRSVIQDEEILAMDFLLNLAVGGIKVQVWEEDAERAAAVLQGQSAEAAPPGSEREPASAGRLTPEADDESDELARSPDEEPVPDIHPADNARDRYAVRALWVGLCSVLILPLAFYTAYLLLMAAFSEGKLTLAPRWAVAIAALLTPVFMLLSLPWLMTAHSLVTTGSLP